jgi:probable rRNA maturation factor
MPPDNLCIEFRCTNPKAWQGVFYPEREWVQLFLKALQCILPADQRQGDLSCLLTSDQVMTRYNGQYRGKPYPTNVLSFPGVVEMGIPSQGMRRPLGDLIFAQGTIYREAQELQRTFGEHFTHLAIHGFLHLLGYDHETPDEAEEMEKLEVRALNAIGIANPYKTDMDIKEEK